MQKPIFIMLIFSLSAIAESEMRVWHLNDGHSVEAEFVYRMRGNVILKPSRGKDLKIPLSNFSEEDLSYIELEMPPKIDLNSSYTTESRKYPDMYGGPSSRVYTLMYTFKMTLRVRSATPYRHPLTVEYFAVAEEANGDKHILVHYQKETFHLDDLPNGELVLESEPIPFTTYQVREYTQGIEYAGFLIAVTDSRGEVIAYKTTRDNWLEYLDNLREVPVTRWFDETCTRCWPTRPRQYY